MVCYVQENHPRRTASTKLYTFHVYATELNEMKWF